MLITRGLEGWSAHISRRFIELSPSPSHLLNTPPQSRGQGGERLDPSGVFSQWNGDGLSSMKRLEMWADHPSKPRVINMLVDRYRAKRDPAAQ